MEPLIALASATDADGLTVGLSAEQPDRDAQLLVCGHYPDKNLTVTERDLDAIVASFSAETVPIRVEHVASPLDPLGLVKRLWRDGSRLMAQIAFDPLAAPLLAARAVRSLSVGLHRDPATKALSLAEVSLVLKPRLPSAALLSDDAGADDDAQTDGRAAALERRLAVMDADAKIRDLKRAGRLVPACEPMARALLATQDGATITLSDGTTQSVAETAFALLSALPQIVRFAETAPGKHTDGDPQDDLYGSATELTPEQHDYCVNVLKVDPEKVRQAMHEQRMRSGPSRQATTGVSSR